MGYENLRCRLCVSRIDAAFMGRLLRSATSGRRMMSTILASECGSFCGGKRCDARVRLPIVFISLKLLVRYNVGAAGERADAGAHTLKQHAQWM